MKVFDVLCAIIKPSSTSSPKKRWQPEFSRIRPSDQNEWTQMENPCRFWIVLIVGALLAGCAAKSPKFHILVTQDGISSTDAERLLISPLEAEFANLDELKTMRSEAFFGSAAITLEFAETTEPIKAEALVHEGVIRAKPQLPAAAQGPTIYNITANSKALQAELGAGRSPD